MIGRTWGQEKLSDWESERHRTHILVVLSSNDCMVRCAGVRSPHRVNTGRDVASALECGEGLEVCTYSMNGASGLRKFMPSRQASNRHQIPMRQTYNLPTNLLGSMPSRIQSRNMNLLPAWEKAQIVSRPQWDCWCLWLSCIPLACHWDPRILNALADEAIERRVLIFLECVYVYPGASHYCHCASQLTCFSSLPNILQRLKVIDILW